MTFRTKFISNSSSSSFIIYSNEDLTVLENYKKVTHEDNELFWDVYKQIVHPEVEGAILLPGGSCYDFNELSPDLINYIIKEIKGKEKVHSNYAYKVKDWGAQGVNTQLRGLFTKDVIVECQGFECD